MKEQEMKQWNEDLKAGTLKEITISEMAQRITTNEGTMKRINRAIAGTRKMKDSYLEITCLFASELISWEELQVLSKNYKNIDDFYTKAITEIMKNEMQK